MIEKMKKYKYSLIISMALFAIYAAIPSAVDAARFVFSDRHPVPLNMKGDEMHPENYATKPVVFTSTTEAVICEGICVLDRVLLTSGLAGSHLIVTDTDDVDLNYQQYGYYLVGKLYGPDTAGKEYTPIDALHGQKVMSTHGISLDWSANSNGESATVFYHRIGD